MTRRSQTGPVHGFRDPLHDATPAVDTGRLIGAPGRSQVFAAETHETNRWESGMRYHPTTKCGGVERDVPHILWFFTRSHIWGALGIYLLVS